MHQTEEVCTTRPQTFIPWICIVLVDYKRFQKFTHMLFLAPRFFFLQKWKTYNEFYKSFREFYDPIMKKIGATLQGPIVSLCNAILKIEPEIFGNTKGLESINLSPVISWTHNSEPRIWHRTSLELRGELWARNDHDWALKESMCAVTECSNVLFCTKAKIPCESGWRKKSLEPKIRDFLSKPWSWYWGKSSLRMVNSWKIYSD